MTGYGPFNLDDAYAYVVYVSGPMTGHPGHNYAAFHHAEGRLRGWGFKDVLNPARNFGGEIGLPRHAYMRLDLEAVVNKANMVVVLPGWEESAGSRLEVLVARELGIPVYDLAMQPVLDTVQTITFLQLLEGSRQIFAYAAMGQPLPGSQVIGPEGFPLSESEIRARYGTDKETESPRSVLEEAQELIHGDRQGSYGHPFDDFTRTGRLWGAILDMPPIEPEKVGLMMAAVKISRACNDLSLDRPIKRDNLTDMAGYTGTVEMVQEYRSAS